VSFYFEIKAGMSFKDIPAFLMQNNFSKNNTVLN